MCPTPSIRMVVFVQDNSRTRGSFIQPEFAGETFDTKVYM